MNNEIKKSLQLTCPTCFSVFQLLEISEQKKTCSTDCQAK